MSDDYVSKGQGLSQIETLIRSKLQERKAVYEKLLQLDAEIEGLRSAQTAIDKLAVMKQALRK